jgi:1-acyl-sn-glycerol-3-phosphate acyltransferase
MTSPIAINRSDGRKSLEHMLKQGLDRVKKGFCITIFPEGTRIKPKKIGRYHIGGAWLATQANLNIIPVAHNAGFYWPKNSFIKKPGVIQVSIGPVIITKNLSAVTVNRKAKEWIENEMLKLNV